jgi:hypothetical protein
MTNRFKQPGMRLMYESCLDSGRRGLWIRTGEQHSGSSHASHFWHGYNGTVAAYCNPADAEYRTTLGYAAFRAGQDFAKED